MKKINWIDHGLNMISVIFGVSLAFIISNYAQDRGKKDETKFLIASILEELEDDIKVYKDYQIPDNNVKADHITRVISILSEMNGNQDSLSFYLNSGALNINNYAPTNISLNSIISTGKLDLINDFQLRKLLLEYSDQCLEAKFRGEFQIEFFTDRMLEWYINNPNYEQEISSSGSDQLQVLLIIYGSLIQNKLSKYKDLAGMEENLIDKLKAYQKAKGFI